MNFEIKSEFSPKISFAMKRFKLVFFLLFCQFGASFAQSETCWETMSKVQSVVDKYETKLAGFLNDSLAEINEISTNINLSNNQKYSAVVKILKQKRTDVLEIKWAGIAELVDIFGPANGKILRNGLKKFLGMTRSPTLFPFKCYVKDAKHLAINAYDTYKFIAQRGIYVKKHL